MFYCAINQSFTLFELMLHAHQLVFNHPITNERITLNATINEEFQKVSDILDFNVSLYIRKD